MKRSKSNVASTTSPVPSKKKVQHLRENEAQATMKLNKKTQLTKYDNKLEWKQIEKDKK